MTAYNSGMLDLTSLVLALLPVKHRKSNTGWYQFNAVCCHHRGHKPDTRGRGNLKSDASGISYSCFNCGFKSRYQGTQLTQNFEQLLKWLGAEHSQIQEIKLLLMRDLMDSHQAISTIAGEVPTQNWSRIELPQTSKPLHEWLTEPQVPKEAHGVQEYLQSRGADLAKSYTWWWCDSSDHHMNQRLLIPMTAHGRVVGYTGRFVGSPPPGVPKYYNSALPPGYLFNWDRLHDNRKFVIVCEGPLDAIAVQGVASMGSTLTESQIYHLVHSDKQVIILPDRTKNNQHMIDVALSFGWAVSFPDWESHIKDAADACKAYGQIYTITSALAARTTNPLTIGVKRKWMPG
jgi:hypothetical protein